MHIQTYLLVLFPLLLSLSSSLQIGIPTALHLSEDQQLSILQEQQTNFEKKINDLIYDLKDIEEKTMKSTNTSEKVILLQNAVTLESKTISQLQASIIPSFNLSKNSCLGLTSDQKVRLANQIIQTQVELNKLKNFTANLKNNPQVASINADIQRQETVLSSIKAVIYSNCSGKIQLSPTVFQSNLYATNWILGRQSINNIVQQYYRRSMQNHNVTNCHIDAPFFDGKNCIQCDKDSPIFNMETSKCVHCPNNTQLNLDKHSCQQKPRFTNYSSVDNYMLDGAKQLPTPPKDMAPCPSTNPYFASTCVKCSLPSYWSVQENKCKDCSQSKVFNVNTKQCQLPQGKALTFLQGNSKWVTQQGNLTKVLQERADILRNINSKYTICGKDTPYYDGIICINCSHEFDLQTKKCIEAPSEKIYNPNVHAYVTPEKNKVTHPNAPNLLQSSTNGTSTSSSSSSNTSIPQNACPFDRPFYDGLSCIICSEPYPLFDTASKKCVQCDHFRYYDKQSRQCKQRPIIYISTNYSNIVATSKMNLIAYKAQQYEKTKNNGISIVKKCKAEEYSNYTHCFTCSGEQKFNIEERRCTKCNGIVNPSTLICQAKKIFLTNLTAKNLIFRPNATKETYQKEQSEIKEPSTFCPESKPYAVKGQQCVLCSTDSPYFDLDKRQCTNCPKDLYYNSITYRCEAEINITNLDGITNFFQTSNYTVINIKKQLQELSKTRKTSLCPKDKPIASSDGSSCLACSSAQYVDLKQMKCIKSKFITNIDALNKTGKILELEDSTLENLKTLQNKTISQKIPVSNCSQSKPLYNGTDCISCSSEQYYNLKELNCFTPKIVSNTTALQASKRYLESDESTLNNMKTDISSYKLPKTVCPETQPLFNGTKCIFCSTEAYYNLKTLQCLNNSYNTKLKNYYPNLNNKRWIASNNGLSALEKLVVSRKALQNATECPKQIPHFNSKTSQCESCPEKQYFDYDKTACSQCQSGLQVDFNTRKCGKKNVGIYQTSIYSKNLLYEGYPKAQFRDQYNENVKKYPNIIDCPIEKPYFNDFECIICPSSASYFSLISKECSSCPEGTSYDQTQRSCLSSSGQLKSSQPDMGKMYSSIF